MAKLSTQQITEVNELIEEIAKSIKPKSEIGSQSKPVLKSLFAANKIKKKLIFFKCKREYSADVVAYFVNEKKVIRNKFHADGKDSIYVAN